MPRLSKRTRAIRARVEANKSYAVDDALSLIKQTATAKFDESVDVAVALGVARWQHLWPFRKLPG